MKKIILAISFVIISSAFSYAAYTAKKPISQEEADKINKEQLLKQQDGDLLIGDAKAPVTIIEYASMSCSHCADFSRETFPKLKEKYIDTGKAKILFRHFPLDEPALRGAMIVTCSGSDKFEKFMQAIFTTQSNWAPKKNYLEMLANIAKLGGMSNEDFESCVKNSDLEKDILMTKYLAVNKMDVRSTPTFFINGIQISGAKSIEEFSEEIEKHLNGSKK